MEIQTLPSENIIDVFNMNVYPNNMSTVLGYNQVMDRPPSIQENFRRILIISSLIILIILPRILYGWFLLEQAGLYEIEGVYSKAATAYAESATRLVWKNGLYEHAARMAWFSGDNNKSLDLFKLAEREDGLTSEGRLILGELHFQAGEFQAALSEWVEIEAGDQNSIKASKRSAETYRLLGEYQDAVEEWKQVILVEPENSFAHYNLGILLMTMKPMEALPELMRAMDLEDGYFEQVQTLREGLNLASMHANPAYQLNISGQSLANIGEWDLAREAFLLATHADPGYPEAWAWLGEADQHTGEDGYLNLQKALSLDRNSAISQAFNGLYFQRKGQIDQSLSAYSHAADLEPENPTWQFALGELTAQKGDLINALAYYQKGVNIAPTNANGWRAMALFCIQYALRVPDLGMNAALQLLKLEPMNWQSFDILGQTLMELDEPSSARVYFSQAIALAPDQADPYLHLGILQIQQNGKEEAYENLLNAHRLDPDGAAGWQAQRLLDQNFP
jgi:tetratricopeptide (TPR) repeat protein